MISLRFFKNFFFFSLSLGTGLERCQMIDRIYKRIELIPKIALMFGDDCETISD